MPSTVRMIWAQARDGVLGVGGALPWHLPEDLRLFRSLTRGSTVVMGRRTWDSLPEPVRPLPGRRNVVLSSGLSSVDGAEVARCVDDVLAAHDDVWVIGGAGVYAAFLPFATEIVMTEIDASFAGDTWAPELPDDWHPETRTPADGWSESAAGLRYAVTVWRREPVPARPDRR